MNKNRNMIKQADIKGALRKGSLFIFIRQYSTYNVEIYRNT